ncbi:MAG: hypothetical protein QM657_11565 [Lacrimispora sp.]|uniref:hypothetical protein n=1 Tax=Lacrimispora sp. TaxID=2719234 RepID=UPI0039E7105F
MKKILRVLTVTALLSISMASAAFAGTWKQNDRGWWWQEKDKTYPSSTWEWIDSDGDGMAECYYFDENGYLLTGTTTPDGYTVNESGAWVDQGLVRQRAADPFTAQAVSQKGKKLYEEASQKTSKLPGLDMNTDLHMTFSYEGLELSASERTQLKYHDLNTANMEFLFITTSSMFGLDMTETSFYTGGCYYTDDYGKYKMYIGPHDMMEYLPFKEPRGEFGVFLDNLQIAEDEAGNKILLYSAEAKDLDKDLNSIYGEELPSLSEFQFSQINGRITINAEGYISNETLSLYMTMTEEGETMGVSMNINQNYNNPGQAISIEFPSTEGYEGVVY